MSCAWRLPFHSATVSVCSETRRQELVSGMWREAPPSALCCQPRVVEGGGVALAHGCWPSGVHEDSSEGLLQPAVPSKCDRRFLIDFEQRCCFSFHLLFLYLLDNLFLKMHISMKTASGNSYVLNPWSKKKKKKIYKSPQILWDYMVLKEIVTVKRACIFQIISALFLPLFLFQKVLTVWV